jgi:outer membrane protein assembly factor BamB
MDISYKQTHGASGLKTMGRELLRGRNKVLLLANMLLVVVFIGAGCTGALGRGIAQGWAGGVVVDDTIIVGSRGGKIMALDAADGTIQGEPIELTAEQPSGGFGCGGGGTTGVAIYSSPVISGELVYVGAYDGKVYAFAFDGEQLRVEPRWVYPRQGDLGGVVIGGLVIVDNIIYLASANGTVYALDAVEGYEEWKYDTGGQIWSTPAVEGDTLFIGSFDKKLYALDIADGSQRWAFETQGAITATPVVNEDKVYFGTFGRRFYAVDITSGEEVWRFPADDSDENKPQNWFWAEPLASNGTIYAPNMDGKVYALDAETGALVNQFDLGGQIVSSPVIIELVTDEEEVYSLIIVATQEGKVYSLNTMNNEQKLLANLGEKVQAPLFASDGIVYIHTFEDNLHAIDVETGGVREFSLATDTSE